MSDISYLDNAASAPLRPETAAALSASFESYANPSSIHALGQGVRKEIEKARDAVAALIRADASEVVFTSGATEANNLAIRGVLEPLLDAGERPHAVTTALEHASVIKTFEALEARGLELAVVAPGPDGVVRAEDVLSAVRPDTALVSVIAVSNELGSLQPVEEIGRKLKDPGFSAIGGPAYGWRRDAKIGHRDAKIFFHVDAVQALVSTEMDFQASQADLFTISAHKIGGPKGIGALAVRKGVKLRPILTGGGHERGLRAGTENISGILGFGAAAEILKTSRSLEIENYKKLRLRLLDGLPPGAKPLLSRDAPQAPHILALECPGKDNDWIVLLLSRAGVMIAAGSACKSGDRSASSIVKALGLDEARAKSVIRASFGWHTTPKDVDACVEALRAALKR